MEKKEKMCRCLKKKYTGKGAEGLFSLRIQSNEMICGRCAAVLRKMQLEKGLFGL